MATLNISLPDSLRQFVDKQVAAGGYATASEYVRELVRQAEKQAVRDRLRVELEKGLNSGPGIVADDNYWAERRAKLLHRLGQKGKLAK